jgi:hypothetical protein
MEMVDNRKALELTFELINAETQLLYSSDYPRAHSHLSLRLRMARSLWMRAWLCAST